MFDVKYLITIKRFCFYFCHILSIRVSKCSFYFRLSIEALPYLKTTTQVRMLSMEEEWKFWISKRKVFFTSLFSYTSFLICKLRKWGKTFHSCYCMTSSSRCCFPKRRNIDMKIIFEASSMMVLHKIFISNAKEQDNNCRYYNISVNAIQI